MTDDSQLETHLRGLLAGAPTSAIDTGRVVAGYRRRRALRTATAAGSLAVAGVLGVIGMQALTPPDPVATPPVVTTPPPTPAPSPTRAVEVASCAGLADRDISPSADRVVDPLTMGRLPVLTGPADARAREAVSFTRCGQSDLAVDETFTFAFREGGEITWTARSMTGSWDAVVTAELGGAAGYEASTIAGQPAEVATSGFDYLVGNAEAGVVVRLMGTPPEARRAWVLDVLLPRLLDRSTAPKSTVSLRPDESLCLDTLARTGPQESIDPEAMTKLQPYASAQGAQITSAKNPLNCGSRMEPVDEAYNLFFEGDDVTVSWWAHSAAWAQWRDVLPGWMADGDLHEGTFGGYPALLYPSGTPHALYDKSRHLIVQLTAWTGPELDSERPPSPERLRWMAEDLLPKILDGSLSER